MKRSNIRTLFLTSAIMLGLILYSTGCARLAVNMSGPWVSGLMDAIKDTRSVTLVKEGISSQVLLVTALSEMSPHNIRLLKESSFLYCAYGLFIEDDDPKYARELYTIGKEYGLRALKQNRKFRKGLAEGKQIAELVGFLDQRYAQALCWTALNSGFYLILNLDDPAALMEMSDVAAMVKRSVELDQNYYYGIGKLFVASYYAMVPEHLGLGGGPQNSKAMFKEARAVTDGKFLLVDLFEARFLASSTDDKELFEKRLEYVLSADSRSLVGGQLLNELAKMKAKIYKRNQDQFF